MRTPTLVGRDMDCSPRTPGCQHGNGFLCELAWRECGASGASPGALADSDVT